MGAGSSGLPGLLGVVCWRFAQGALLVLGLDAPLWHPGVREGRVRGWGGTGSKTEFNLQTVFRGKGACDIITSPHGHHAVASDR